jgi:hypothetical protein
VIRFDSIHAGCMAERKGHGVLEASYKAKAQYHELEKVHNPENIEDYEPSALNIRKL